MSRAEAIKLWERAAAGDFDLELLEWLRARAAEIVDADQAPADKRRDAVVRATGLVYRAASHPQVRDRVELVLEFPLVAADGQEREPVRGERMRTLIAHAREAEPGWTNLSDDEVRKRLERLFAR